MMLHISTLQSQVVKGRQYSGIVSTPTLHTAWAENIANAWLPYTNIWETWHISYLKVKIKIPSGQIASFCSFCMQVYKKVLCEVLPGAVNIIYIFFLLSV